MHIHRFSSKSSMDEEKRKAWVPQAPFQAEPGRLAELLVWHLRKHVCREHPRATQLPPTTMQPGSASDSP